MDIEKLKEQVDNHRLLTVILFGWLVFSNLMYFSQVGGYFCVSFGKNGEISSSSQPMWETTWYTVTRETIGTVSLYELKSDYTKNNGYFKIGHCSEMAYRMEGHIAFILSPLVFLLIVYFSIQWIKAGKRQQ